MGMKCLDVRHYATADGRLVCCVDVLLAVLRISKSLSTPRSHEGREKSNEAQSCHTTLSWTGRSSGSEKHTQVKFDDN